MRGPRAVPTITISAPDAIGIGPIDDVGVRRGGEASAHGDIAASPKTPRGLAMRSIDSVARLVGTDMDAVSVLAMVITEANDPIAMRAAQVLGELVNGFPEAAGVMISVIESAPPSAGLVAAIRVGMESADERVALAAETRMALGLLEAADRVLPMVYGRAWGDREHVAAHAMKLVEIGWDHLANGWSDPKFMATAMAEADLTIRRVAALDRGIPLPDDTFSAIMEWGRSVAETVLASFLAVPRQAAH